MKPPKKIKKEIAFNRCWECGRVRILGEWKNGKVERMPRAEWLEAKEALGKALRESRNARKTKKLVSSIGTKWTDYFAKHGFKAVLVSEKYCGC